MPTGKSSEAAVAVASITRTVAEDTPTATTTTKRRTAKKKATADTPVEVTEDDSI